MRKASPLTPVFVEHAVAKSDGELSRCSSNKSGGEALPPLWFLSVDWVPFAQQCTCESESWTGLSGPIMSSVHRLATNGDNQAPFSTNGRATQRLSHPSDSGIGGRHVRDRCGVTGTCEGVVWLLLRKTRKVGRAAVQSRQSGRRLIPPPPPRSMYEERRGLGVHLVALRAQTCSPHRAESRSKAALRQTRNPEILTAVGAPPSRHTSGHTGLRGRRPRPTRQLQPKRPRTAAPKLSRPYAPTSVQRDALTSHPPPCQAASLDQAVLPPDHACGRRIRTPPPRLRASLVEHGETIFRTEGLAQAVTRALLDGEPCRILCCRHSAKD